MSEENVTPVLNYSPPTNTTSNIDQAQLLAVVEQLVKERLAAAGVTHEPAKVLTPEEATRASLDNAGIGLGVDERLAELYRALDILAKKVGI